MRKLLSLFWCLLAGCHSTSAVSAATVGGEDDRWMLFERETASGLPLVVLRRIDNVDVENSLEKDPLTIVRCFADVSIVNDRGMPGNTDRIYPLEDMLANSDALREAQALHIASVTGEGARQVIYAHPRSVEFSKILAPVKIEGYSCSAAQAVDRSAILKLVMPSELDRKLDGDHSVISNLQKQGDDGTAQRRTDFFFYGKRQALKAVAQELAPKGFKIGEWRSNPIGLVLYREMPVDFGTFRRLTPELLSIKARLNVEYDGWETFVVRPESKTTPSGTNDR